MKIRISVIAAAVVLFAGCTQELAPVTETTPSKTTIKVSIGETKTYMGDLSAGVHKVYWSNGDKIAVNGTASDALDGLADNTVSAEFTFASAPSAPYKAVYPASIYTDATHVTLPTTQVYKSASFADGMNPMAGYNASAADFTMHHLCAILRVSVKRSSSAPADEDKLLAVRFKGRNSEQVCGLFEIDYENAVLTGSSSAAADKEVRVIQSLETSTATAAVYYVVVPAGTYSSGFDVTVQDANGHIQTKSVTTSKALEAGHLYNMPEFEFVPTGTELGITISSAQDLIDFATAYNNKEYDALGSALVASLTADITFDATSSAAFNATGGIGLKTGANGSEDYYFNGTFNGAGHAINGLIATVPLFVATGSNGVVKDFTINDDCTFTFTHKNAADAHFGSVAGYHKGTINDVTVKADVTLAAASEVAYETCIGGITGRETTGIVDGCEYLGAITIPADFQSASKRILIGGIVGRISNSDGKVLDTDFKGTIENEGQMIASEETDELKRNPFLLIGGIAGLNSGTVSGCEVANHATGITVTLNDGSDHDYSGTIVTHSTNAYHWALGGIVGRNDGTISDCTNNANIANIFSAARGTSGNLNGRYLNVGGIAGFNAAEKTINGCTNNGAIIDRANPKMHYVGGIVGFNKGSVSSCSNSNTGAIGIGTSHASPYGARQLYAGGIVGYNDTGASLSDIQNAGGITASRLENTSVISALGGIVGRDFNSLDGSANGGTISNTGAIAQTSGIGMISETPTDSNPYGYYLGGITGYTSKDVKNVSNSGNVAYTCNASGIGAQYVHVAGIVGKVNAASTVDVEHCSNTAKVTFTASATHKSNNATRYYYNYLGGIVGYARHAAIKGDLSNKTTNSGQIKGGDGSDNNNQPSPSFMVGGIVGYLTGESSIEYCNLTGTGNPYNDHWSNRGISSYDCPAVGGIAGQIVGEEGKPITVSNCAVESTASVNARRGAVGGIVGLAQYASISTCTMPVDFSTSQSGYFYGGIVAAAKNSTISNCSFSATTIQSSQLQIAGGIIGQLDTDSSVAECNSSATTVNKNGTPIETTGGIAGKSVAGASIKDCHFTSTIGKICGDSNFTDGGGNTADL